MALPNMHRAASALRAPSVATLAALETTLSGLRITSPTAPSLAAAGRRHASHQAQGRANGAKDGAGKRLGAKKTGGEYVVPGNILFKQRGTHWYPGDGCDMGRDHTIHAAVPGYVKYYRDPIRHPKRKFIGIVFEKNQVLPQPANAVRRRKLGMLAFQMPPTVTEQTDGDVGDLTPAAPQKASADAGRLATVNMEKPRETRLTKIVKRRVDGKMVETKLTLRPGYQWRQANWEIGRAAERSKAAQKVRAFQPGDRFLAWRKRNERIARNAERRAMGRGGKGKGKGKKK